MRKICFSLLMCCALHSTVFGQIKGSTMGGLVSVVEDGPFDSGRNPALLILSKEKGSIGVLGRYRVYESHDTSFKAPLEVRQEEPQNTVAGVNISAVFPVGNRVLGFTLCEGGNDLYQYSINKLEIKSAAEAQIEKSREISINPVMGAAICLQLSDNSAMGFQLFFGYSRVNKKTTKEFQQPVGTLMDRITVDKDLTQTIGCSPGFGYIYHTGSSQVGLMVRGGSFTFVSERMEYTYRIPVSYSDSREYPYTFVYNGNISIAVGAYQKLNKTIGIAFEGIYTLQNSYSQQNLKLKEDFSMDTAYIDRTKSTVSNRSGVAVKAGADIVLSRRFSVTAGIAYYFNESLNIMSNYSEQSFTRLSIYLATAGFHYSVNDAVSISLMLNCIYLDGDYKIDTSGLSLRVDDASLLADAGIGCTMKF